MVFSNASQLGGHNIVAYKEKSRIIPRIGHGINKIDDAYYNNAAIRYSQYLIILFMVGAWLVYSWVFPHPSGSAKYHSGLQ